jgi:hypothetical protein
VHGVGHAGKRHDLERLAGVGNQLAGPVDLLVGDGAMTVPVPGSIAR